MSRISKLQEELECVRAFASSLESELLAADDMILQLLSHLETRKVDDVLWLSCAKNAYEAMRKTRQPQKIMNLVSGINECIGKDAKP